MYDDLVKRLRSECSLPFSTIKDMRDAANAIEDLSKLADAIPHVCECCVGCEMEKKNGGCDNAFVLSPKRAMQYLIKPRWIPVTERLPEEEKTVMTWGKGHQCISLDWMHDNKWCCFGDADYWMPLPEPPEKESES